MIKNDLVVREESSNFLINQYFKQSRDLKVSFVEIGNTKNLSGYILIKKNIESISTSKRNKKAKGFYLEVIFAGLRQPTKNISISTYTVLSGFIKRFKIDSMDICFDGLSKLDINENTLMMYQYLFKDYIGSFKDTYLMKSSFYINKPISKETDTNRFKKILVYDKYLKESRYKKLDENMRDWKRLEFTLNVQYKLKGFNLDDYLEDMKEMAFKYFNTSRLGLGFLEQQIKLLTDKRTHRGIKSL